MNLYHAILKIPSYDRVNPCLESAINHPAIRNTDFVRNVEQEQSNCYITECYKPIPFRQLAINKL